MRYKFVTLSGHCFSQTHNYILETFARSRKCTSNVWVPLTVAELLQLSLKRRNDVGIRLCFDELFACEYYHISQFDLDESEIHMKWNKFVQTHSHLMPLHCTPAKERLPTSSISFVQHCTEMHENTAKEESLEWLPRNTNGERFNEVIEQKIISRFDLKVLGSCYFVTPEEASYIYNAPLHSSVLKEERHMVEIPIPLCPFPVKYYHCSGSERPEVFTSLTCQRYDPLNFEGNFYSAPIAVRMKRYALRHHCLHEPRWLSFRRIIKLNCTVKFIAEPFILTNSQNKLLELVNISFTNNPEYVERCAREFTELQWNEKGLTLETSQEHEGNKEVCFCPVAKKYALTRFEPTATDRHTTSHQSEDNAHENKLCDVNNKDKNEKYQITDTYKSIDNIHDNSNTKMQSSLQKSLQYISENSVTNSVTTITKNTI